MNFFVLVALFQILANGLFKVIIATKRLRDHAPNLVPHTCENAGTMQMTLNSYHFPDDLDMDRPIDYGNLHLLSSSYLPPRSQPPVEEPRSNQSPLRMSDINQSPFRSTASDQSALKPDRLLYSSLLLHGSDAEDAADGGSRDMPLNYSSLLLPDSEPEEEDSGSGSSDHQPRDTCDEQCGLMEVSV